MLVRLGPASQRMDNHHHGATRRFWLLLGLCIAVAALACRDTAIGVPPSPTRLTPVALAGTYSVRICRGSCSSDDTTADLRRGVLVLTAQPIDLTGQPDSVQWLMEDFRPDPINGCYVLRYVRDDPPTYAGGSVGGTQWELDSSGTSVFFSLYRSPDAGYLVEAIGTRSGLRGRGTSWGVGIAEVHFPDDSVVATRIGPPDVSTCLAAVGPAWVEIMNPTRHGSADNPEHGSR
ncbi:MAG TPA: hypothetical protein VFK13_07540 [Gemmatimonadaceae bacterium]|nr:hypothetical protein [Gemmatimonadaceae bacterium]